MPIDRSSVRYTMVAIILHWVMALGIGLLAVMGWVMVHAKLDPPQLFQLYQLHKSIGITLLLAAVFRLVWRLTHRPPPLPETMPPLERAAAKGGHLLLYLFLFGLPLTGWALVSSSVFNIPTVLYGVISWPDLPFLSTLADKAPVEAVLKLMHAYGAYALIALVGLHAAAALRHHFIVKDDVLLGMLPSLVARRRSAPESTQLEESK
ncbi:MAG: cytochrome [Devosia sp.]|uniref:cytochrome b n=1 Tax=Devosia sp. TaxID=1871048 RepID=UPI00262D41C4|nr:cytochrome b [Devosia sp.]MDB5526996.1 cytochrome [Devosia sp.]